MKREDIFNGVTDIRDDLIDAAGRKQTRTRKRSRTLWAASIAAVLAVAVLAGVLLRPGGGLLVGNSYAIALAEYPEMPHYPNESNSLTFDKEYDAWWEAKRALWMPQGTADGLEDFFAASARQFLSGAGTENRVYSPLNVYMALAMLAEVTDGESRAQILNLLGQESIESLREQAGAVWRSSYSDDGAVTSVLASSLWLNQDVRFVQSTMEALAEHYYASSYRGEMGSEEFNRALQDWLNEQTGGLLEKQAGGISLDPDTILALAATVYFRAKWISEFSPNQTEKGVFHAPGGELTCRFMHQKGDGNYFWGDRFSAVSRGLEGSGQMWLILPDEGVTPEELLQDGQLEEFLRSPYEWENRRYLVVNQVIPKFDVCSDLDLISGLKQLGITDVFDPAISDFTPMTRDTEEIFLSQVGHAARVAIDEEGIVAAAYTVIPAPGAGIPPEEEVDFVLDRPFLFVVIGQNGLPLFAGVVNRPV